MQLVFAKPSSVMSAASAGRLAPVHSGRRSAWSAERILSWTEPVTRVESTPGPGRCALTERDATWWRIINVLTRGGEDGMALTNVKSATRFSRSSSTSVASAESWLVGDAGSTVFKMTPQQ